MGEQHRRDERRTRLGQALDALAVEAVAGDGEESQTGSSYTVGREPSELDALAAARDAAARTPLDALDLSGPPAFLEPPPLPEPGLRWGTW